MMKKIVIDHEIKSLIEKEKSFLARSSIKLFTANSKEEMLDIHTSKKVDLIITKFDMPAISCEMFCSVIRKDRALRKVSIIILCNNNSPDLEKSSRCNANAVVTIPIDLEALLEKSHQLLHVAKREAYRVMLGLKINGKYREVPFMCYSENISSSGMLIETDKVMAKGDKVICSFFLPDSRHITAEGEVVRIVKKPSEYETNQYGIRFNDISPDLKSALESFIEKRSRD